MYTPQSNGRLEGWHRFFKACIAKHIRGGGVEWDELVPLAVSAYNFFPCQSSKESPFVLMFGRDPITPVAKLLEPRPRYYGERGSALKMDTLRRLYTVVVQNIRKAREKLPKKEEEPHKFKVNDMVLVKDPDAAVFEPRYQPNFRVMAIFGNNRIEVQDERGQKSVRRSAHVKYIAPSEKVVKQLPSEQVLKNYGRSTKLFLAPKDIPDLHFDVTDKKENGDSPERTDVMEIMDPELHSNASEYREHSQKSRNSGKLTDVETSGNIVHQMFDRDAQQGNSDFREHSQNSREKQAGAEIVNVKVTVSANDTKRSATSSDFPEHSQNSLPSGECELDNGGANVSSGDRDGQCSVSVSEFRELSPNSWVETECSEVTQKKHHTRPVCVGEPSEYSQDSLRSVGSNVSVPSFSWFKSMSQIVGLTATWQDKVEGNPTGAGTASNVKINTNPVHTEFNFFL